MFNMACWLYYFSVPLLFLKRTQSPLRTSLTYARVCKSGVYCLVSTTPSWSANSVTSIVLHCKISHVVIQVEWNRKCKLAVNLSSTVHVESGWQDERLRVRGPASIDMKDAVYSTYWWGSIQIMVVAKGRGESLMFWCSCIDMHRRRLTTKFAVNKVHMWQSRKMWLQLWIA